MEHFSLADKNIIVTGASSGIGASCAITCSKAGANLLLLGRDKNKLGITLNKLKYGNHSILSYDLVNIEGLEKALEEPLKKFGKIHGFIHSAGFDISRPLNSLRYSDYKSIFDINVISGFEIARVISKRQYCDKDGASYVFIASVLGVVGRPATVAYSASKGAIIAGCRSMALELSLKKIKVNCISPSTVLTELSDRSFAELPVSAKDKIESMHPLGFGHTEDIANTCLFLLANETRWITGSNIIVDGGYSIQ